jgi:hypothetical protein
MDWHLKEAAGDMKKKYELMHKKGYVVSRDSSKKPTLVVRGLGGIRRK